MESDKIIGYSVLALGVGVVIFAIVSTSKSKKSQSYLDAPTAGSNQSFNAKKIAETLYDAMKGINFTNDEKNDIVFSTLTGINQTQFGEIFKAFGSRRYNTITGQASTGIYSYNLRTWLKEELSASSFRQLQESYPKYL